MKKETLYGLIANPASHSLSPLIQNSAFKKSGINARYLAFDVERKYLSQAVNGLIALNAGGFNVSTPFKTEIISYLDEIDHTAKKLNSVNTVKIEKGKLRGYSTDGDGFWQSLKSISLAHVLILGTGGAARAIMSKAKKYGVEDISIFNRSSLDWSKKKDVVDRLTQTSLYNLDDRELLAHKLKKSDLVINATTVGMKSNNTSLLSKSEISLCPPKTMFIDIIYQQRTPLLQRANAQGYKTKDGISMLIHQGALSFKIWTGISPDVNEMRKAIELN